MLETLWNDHNAEPDCSADEALTVCLEVDPLLMVGWLVGGIHLTGLAASQRCTAFKRHLTVGYRLLEVIRLVILIEIASAQLYTVSPLPSLNPIYLSSRGRISLTAAESSTKWREGTIPLRQLHLLRC